VSKKEKFHSERKKALRQQRLVRKFTTTNYEKISSRPKTKNKSHHPEFPSTPTTTTPTKPKKEANKNTSSTQ